jgi:MATE family multidrug resistance protein
MAGETLMGIVDTKLVGGLGPAALGGVGIAMTLAWLGYMVTFGVMRGIKVCVAHAVGEGRAHQTVRYAQAGVVLGVASGAVLWACTRDVSPLLRAIGVDDALVPYARVFLATYTIGAPASAATSAMNHYRQAIGDSRTPMFVGLAGNALNVALGWALIYGHFGLSALGVRGGAIATATSEAAEAMVLLTLLARDVRRANAAADLRAELPLSRAAREVAEVGVPTGLQLGSEMLAMVALTSVLGTFGAEQVAAHQIALSTIRASFLPGVAVSEAASVMVGKALGRRALESADRVTRAALLLAVSFMAACAVVFALEGSAIAGTFSNDPAVTAVAKRLLSIAAAFQVLDAVAIVLRGALRGAKDVRIPAAIGVAVAWTFIPTSAWVLGRVLGWGAAGGWVGFVGETSLGAALFAWRWSRGGWRAAYPSLGPRAPGHAARSRETPEPNSRPEGRVDARPGVLLVKVP